MIRLTEVTTRRSAIAQLIALFPAVAALATTTQVDTRAKRKKKGKGKGKRRNHGGDGKGGGGGNPQPQCTHPPGFRYTCSPATMLKNTCNWPGGVNASRAMYACDMTRGLVLEVLDSGDELAAARATVQVLTMAHQFAMDPCIPFPGTDAVCQATLAQLQPFLGDQSCPATFC